jgi:LPXTG-motif cell wall-anchored protein
MLNNYDKNNFATRLNPLTFTKFPVNFMLRGGLNDMNGTIAYYGQPYGQNTSSTGTTIMILVGVFIVVAITVFAIFWLMRRKKSKPV